MRITARGWRRDSGAISVCEHEISDAVPHTGTTYDAGTLYLNRIRGGVDLKVGPSTLTLGGRYQVSLHLTDEDVMRLYFECFPNVRSVASRVLSAGDTEEDDL